MAWNGAGTFTRTNGVFSGATVWAQDAAVPTNITTAHFDTHDQDLAVGINACLTKNGENAMTGTLNGVRVKMTSATAVSLASTNHALELGTPGAANLAFDPSNIQGRNNGAKAALGLNPLGGDVNLGFLSSANQIYARQQLVVADNAGATVAAPATYASNAITLALQGQVTYQAFDRYSADANCGIIIGRKSRNTTIGSHTIVQNGDASLAIDFLGSNGTSYDVLARIIGFVDGVPGASNDMPGRLDFYTTPDGSSTTRNVFRLNNAANAALLVDGAQYLFQNTNQSALYMPSTATVNLQDVTGSKAWLQATRSAGVESFYNGVGELKTVDHTTAANGASGAQVKDGGGTYRPAGFNMMAQNAQNANYTPALSDAGHQIAHSSGSHTYTTNASGDLTFPVGCAVTVVNAGGTLSIAPGASTNLYWFGGAGSLPNATRSIAIGGFVTLWRVTAADWYLTGIGIS